VTEKRPASRATTDDLPLDDLIEVQGDALPGEQDAVISPDEMERARPATRTELDRGEPSPDLEFAEGDSATLDGLDLDDLREGETDDPDVAAEEGLVYVPPIDPPVLADAEEEDGVVVAAGPAVSAESEPYDEDHRSDDLSTESELTDLIRSALRADAATAGLVDRLVIGTRGTTVVIRGIVDDIEDSDAIAEVVQRVDGVENVIDQTDVAEG
jgi:hypothetical protein